jgi:hypothetical protein
LVVVMVVVAAGLAGEAPLVVSLVTQEVLGLDYF